MNLEQEGILLHPILNPEAAQLSNMEKLAGAKILLVEDNETNQEVAKTILEDFNFFVTIAENGEQALMRLTEKNFDLVFMDMHMPVMDGITATIEIRKKDEYKNLPIIAMTANAMHTDREQCFAAGMNDYVSKPIDIGELMNCLLKWLKPKNLVVTNREMKKAVADVDITFLYSVGELDVDGALRRLIHRKELYLNMVRKFVLEGNHFSMELESTLEEGDLYTGERLAHTLKSILGNIGATELQEQAEILERILRMDQRENAELHIGEREHTMKHLTDGIEALIVNLKESGAGVWDSNHTEQVSDEETRVILDRLITLLEEDDPEALSLFIEKEYVVRRALPEKFSKLSKLIRGFEFEEALELFRKGV